MTGGSGVSVALRDDVVWKESDDAVIVLDTRSSLYLSIGGTGPLLWPLLVEGTTAEHLADLLVATFSVDGAMAGRDVGLFLDSLRQHDLLA